MVNIHSHLTFYTYHSDVEMLEMCKNTCLLNLDAKILEKDAFRSMLKGQRLADLLTEIGRMDIIINLAENTNE